MSIAGIVILIVAVLVVVAAIAAGVLVTRRRALQKRFGPEYDRLVAEQPSRSAAEQELRERERRHAGLTLRPLSEQSRAQYATEWAQVQARFVDSPAEAVREGDALVTRLVGEIGYPTGSDDEQMALLSVEHAGTLSHYRDAHEISIRNERGEASTEQLRQALVHFRALFAELLGAEPIPAEPIPAEPVYSAGTAPGPATESMSTATTADADHETGAPGINNRATPKARTR
jgi:hypothetical protein